jgi:hypothetical protein
MEMNLIKKNQLLSSKKRIEIILLITFLFSIISLIQTQLTSNEISVIQKNLLENQDETTGLFNKSFNSSLKTLKILRTLNTQIKNTSKICRDLSYESGNEIKLEYLELNTLLDCKISFTNLEGVKQENFEKKNFLNFYEALLININLKENINWENVFELLNNFDDDFFTRNNKDEREQNASLTFTAKSLKMLSYIANLPNNTPEFREKVIKKIQETWENLFKAFEILKDVINK